ncbi:MAG: acetate--CoA ligase family protein [Alphaproteobacteria bacterium]
MASLSDMIAAGRTALSEVESKALLATFGVKSPARVIALDGQALAEAAADLSPPFAVKILSDSGAHKSDVGGVALNVQGAAAIEAAVAGMPISDAGYLLEEMAPAGVEMVVGGYRHPRFGPVLMVGFGGVLVELLDDLVFRVCPVDQADVESMLGELRGAPLLNGYRGKPAIDRQALIDAILAIGGADGLLMAYADDVAEFDVNPLIASATGVIAVDARAALAASNSATDRPPLPDFGPLMAPNAVAVAGASATKPAHGNLYIRQLKAFGFKGPIYPIHPRAGEVEGLTTVPTLADLPEPVDYAYVAVGGSAAMKLLRESANKVRFAQVMASGFDGLAEKQALAAAAWAGGARLLGPNCLGVHAPAGGLSFMAGADTAVGGVAVLAQSGGLSMDILRRGARRGVKYRTVVTMGDAADLGPADLLPWLLDDPETKVIGLYMEDAPSGRALFETLQAAKGRKPVVLLVGGRTSAGARAAASHTGALASDGRVWAGIAKQTAAALVDTLDDFIDALLACQSFTPRYGAPTKRVVLFGNGGGAGVLAADGFYRAGLEIGPLDAAAAGDLAAIDLPAGASAANPIDVPGNILQRDNGRFGVQVVESALMGDNWDAFVMHMNVPGLLTYEHVDILGPLIEAGMQAASKGGGHVALVLRSDGEPAVEVKKQAYAAQALAAGAAVFNELDDAARALTALAAIEAV